MGVQFDSRVRQTVQVKWLSQGLNKSDKLGCKTTINSNLVFDKFKIILHPFKHYACYSSFLKWYWTLTVFSYSGRYLNGFMATRISPMYVWKKRKVCDRLHVTLKEQTGKILVMIPFERHRLKTQSSIWGYSTCCIDTICVHFSETAPPHSCHGLLTEGVLCTGTLFSLVLLLSFHFD